STTAPGSTSATGKTRPPAAVAALPDPLSSSGRRTASLRPDVVAQAVAATAEVGLGHMPRSAGTGPAIAILGGGIGGLAAAAFLRRAGLACTVYEQAAQLREIGAGLVVAPNAARLLRQLGVLDAFEERAVRLDVGWEFRRWQDGTIL